MIDPHTSPDQIQLAYFSDVLCVWAYVSQIRLNELKENFGADIEIEQHFVNIFGNTEERIGQGWSERGAYQGFNAHVLDVCKSFTHVEINPDIWTVCRPKSSGVSHLFIKSLQTLEQQGRISAERIPEYENRTAVEEFIWRVRSAFFKEARDIGRNLILFDIAEQMRLSISAIKQQLDDGTAMAALCGDLEKRDTHKIDGSPTYLLNDGRQKLYGNVGYRIIEANVLELLARSEDQASWC